MAFPRDPSWALYSSIVHLMGARLSSEGLEGQEGQNDKKLSQSSGSPIHTYAPTHIDMHFTLTGLRAASHPIYILSNRKVFQDSE